MKLPFALTLAADTAQQVEAGNFAQGGRNEFRTLMDDQATNGMYKTKVLKILVKAENADTNSDRSAAQTQKTNQNN